MDGIPKVADKRNERKRAKRAAFSGPHAVLAHVDAPDDDLALEPLEAIEPGIALMRLPVACDLSLAGTELGGVASILLGCVRALGVIAPARRSAMRLLPQRCALACDL